MKSPSALKTLLFSLLAILLGSLVLASISRVALTALDDLADLSGEPFVDWYVVSPDLGWERRPGYSGSVWGVPREFAENRLFQNDASQLAEPSPRRVVIMGDSNTFGLYVPPEETFVEVIDRALPEVDVINWGVPGYSSYQGRVLLDSAVLPLKPDVIVISYGYNDRRMVRRPHHVDGRKRFTDLNTRYGKAEISNWLERSYLYQGLGKIMDKTGLLGREESISQVDLPMDEWLPRVAPADYRENLRFMVRAARAGGAKVVLLLIYDNPTQTFELDLGMASLQQGDMQSAIQNLKIAVARDNLYSPLARISLARVYRSLGNEEEAGRSLKPDNRRSIFGGTVSTLDDDYHLIMEEVAGSLHVPLVDAGRLLQDRPWVYQDEYHFDAEGHAIVGKHLQKVLVEVVDR